VNFQVDVKLCNHSKTKLHIDTVVDYILAVYVKMITSNPKLLANVEIQSMNRS
jgi:hypothetical protein